MKVRVWRSFSGNNSGGFYLVGAFESAEVAAAVASDLRQFLETLRAEVEELEPRARWSLEEPTPTARSFAAAHGVEWTEPLTRGQADDTDIEVDVAGTQVLCHHDYGLGFSPGLPTYIEARGGQVNMSGRMFAGLRLSLLVQVGDDATALATVRERFTPAESDTVEFHDGDWVGIVMPFEPERLADLRAFLAEQRLDDPIMAFDRHRDEHRFAAMPTARCAACDSDALRYLPDEAYDVGGDQIACQGCGGMFEAASFFTGHVAHLTLRSGTYDVNHCFDPLRQERYVIGRSRGGDLHIQRGSIARRHAMITFEEDEGFVLHDLGGTNGVSLGDARLQTNRPRRLESGDVIGLPDDLTITVELVPRG